MSCHDEECQGGPIEPTRLGKTDAEIVDVLIRALDALNIHLVCTDTRAEAIYIFDGNRWKEDQGTVKIYSVLEDTLSVFYKQLPQVLGYIEDAEKKLVDTVVTKTRE